MRRLTDDTRCIVPNAVHINATVATRFPRIWPNQAFLAEMRRGYLKCVLECVPVRYSASCWIAMAQKAFVVS